MKLAERTLVIITLKSGKQLVGNWKTESVFQNRTTIEFYMGKTTHVEFFDEVQNIDVVNSVTPVFDRVLRIGG